MKSQNKILENKKEELKNSTKIEKLKTAPTQNKDYSISPNDRVFVCGKTGSGKTTLVKYLLATAKRLIVIDGKDGIRSKWNLEDYKATRENKNLLINHDEYRFRLVNDMSDIIEVLNIVYDNGNEDAPSTIIYIDEVTATIEPKSKTPQIFTDIWTRGRSRKIGAWSNTQRPTNVPLIFLSESEHIFEFTLNLEDDRKRVSQIIGKQALIKPIPCTLR